VPNGDWRTLGYRVGDGHRVLAYVTDHCPTVLDLAAGADLLIHDAQLVARFADAPVPVFAAAEGLCVDR
jgi:ribonuclease BN (tRNA processing enzyme)